MKLNETIEMMSSGDYKERFKAEYNQLIIRYSELKSMFEKWDNGMLMFKPNCPRGTYNMQVAAMIDYLAVLESRAAMEGIEINNVVKAHYISFTQNHKGYPQKIDVEFEDGQIQTYKRG